MKKSMSINDLTQDDTKIIGELVNKKLEKISSKNHFNTSQYQTVYSNWTPVSNKQYNKTIFKERKELIFNWFDIWTDQQRNDFLLELFNKFSAGQLLCVYDYFNKKIPLKRVDFTRILPRNISLKIFSYLDPRSLSRSSQVSWHWKFLTEQDILWVPKCRTFGWYLPYSPSEFEFGAWKRHYLSNAISVDMSVGQIRGSVWRRLAITEDIKPISSEKSRPKHVKSDIEEIIKSAITKPQWSSSSSFPHDIEQASKALFAGLNPNESVNLMESIDFSNLPRPSPRIKTPRSSLTPRNIKDKITLSNLLSWEERRMTELINQKSESFIQGNHQSDSDEKKSDIVKCGNNEPLPWQKPSLNNMYQLQSIASGYSGWTNPRVIFISSKLPGAEILLDSVIFGVIPIPYDFDSTTLKTMIYDLESVLRGRKAMSIGLFGHRNRENEMWIVRNKCFSRKNNNSEHPELLEFMNSLAANIKPKNENGHIHLFIPFGAFEAGNEMLIEMNEFTKSTFVAPISAVGQYKFILGEWTINTEGNVHPCYAYFSINKLNFWLEFGEAVNEICADTKSYLKNQYPEIDDFLLKQLTGSIVREASLTNPDLDTDIIIRNLWEPLSKCNDKDPLVAILEHLRNSEINKVQISVKEPDVLKPTTDSTNPSVSEKDKFKDTDKIKEKVKKDKEKNKEKDKDKSKKKDKDKKKDKKKDKIVLNCDENISFQQDMKSKYLFRKSVIKELLLNEKRYLQIIKCINDYYYMPLKRALLSNRMVLGPHNIQVIFGDILMFIGPSESLILNLDSRLSQWSTETCIGDLLENHINDISIIYGTFFISYSNSLETIERCRETNLKFRNFLAMHDNQPESGMISLNELFLKPVNRILEYMSIIHWALSNTPPEHADIEHLRRSLGGLTKINKIIVQEKSRISRAKKFKEIEESIINCPILIEPGRYFITKENLCLYMPSTNTKSIDPDFRFYRQAKDCGLFMFNDSIILTRITRELQPYCRTIIHNHSFEKALDLSKISLYDIPDRKDMHSAFQIQCGSRSWILGCHSTEKKYHLTTILREYINTVNNKF